MMQKILLKACLIASFLVCGCSSTGAQKCVSDHPQIEYGRRAPIIDATGWVLGIPNKIMLWDRRADNHNVQPETVAKITNYLDSNHLENVKVRVNQYDPLGEWNRLVENKSISPGWRYTVGAFRTAGYTLLPGRLFGNDSYNPFTNTLSVYSDLAPLGISEAAYAKDVSRRELPGTYATFQQFPVIGLWHETLATQEALDHYQFVESEQDLKHARHILYSRYGVNVGGDISGLFIGETLGPELLGAAAGHLQAHRENKSKRSTKVFEKKLTSLE